MDALQGYAVVSRAMERRGHDVKLFADAKLEAALRDCLNDTVLVESSWSMPVRIRIDGKDVGTLQSPDVEAIKAAGQPALFGKGTETVHDESVRKALDISADRIELFLYEYGTPLVDFAQWSCVSGALRELFGTDVEVVPYKLNVYGPGDFFDEHVDTVRHERHVGTFVLALRSEHEGGDLVVWLDDEKDTFESETILGNPNSLRFAAFPTDASHKIEPVTSGTRITLVCNVLVADKKAGNSDEEADDDEEETEAETCERMIKEYWDNTLSVSTAARSDFAATPGAQPTITHGRRERIDRFVSMLDGQTGTVAFLLHHRYALASLKIECLKGIDRILVDELRQRWPCVVSPMVVSTSDYGDDDIIVEVVLAHPKLLADECAKVDDLFEPPAKKARKMKLHVVKSASSAWLLKHNKGAEHTGNEAAPSEYAYWISAVIVDFDA